ncbi:MAG: hypothetical protein QNK19_02370 [Xanthomonadales bacterium]|nr:hypothetical protein [Xanthomonadales bacterium]
MNEFANLEGELEPLNASFERLARDTRHDADQLISFTGTEVGKFADWEGIGNSNTILSEIRL